MTFTVNAPVGAGVDESSPSPFIITEAERSGHSEIEYTASVAPGVGITWNPFDPRRWRSIVVEPGEVDLEPVLKGLVGAKSAADLREAVRDLASSDRETTEVEERGSANGDRSPWLRLAALMTLDRWLYAPLDPALLAAEEAAAQVAVAATLPRGSRSRQAVVEEALYRARQASAGLTRYLERFVLQRHRPPAVLEEGLRRLALAYSALAKELEPEEFDDELAAVPEAWHRLTDLESSRGVEPSHEQPETAHENKDHPLDPRTIPARVLRLAEDPAENEIEIEEIDGGRALRITVAAFGNETADRLIARLVDERTGQAVAHALLTPAGGDLYEAVLPGEKPGRPEIYDVLGEPRTDEGLQSARRAVAFLRAWRRFAARLKLDPDPRIPAVIHTLAEQQPDDRPLWTTGPAPQHLRRIVELDTATLSKAISRGDNLGMDDETGAVLTSTCGPGALLVAELAAAYEPRLTRR